jgi:regulator of sigma E protease
MMVTLLVFAGSILLLVGIHEAGHFLAAKAFGVYVMEFAVGFGPRMAAWKGKETRYSIRAIPFGGYVRMAGEDRRETDPSIPEGRLLYHKPPGVRAVISLAGPVANLILAVVVSILVIWATDFPVVQVADVIDETPAAQAFRPGDRVLEIDGRPIYVVDQISDAIQRADGSEVSFFIRREGEPRTVDVLPAYREDEQRYVVGAYFHSVTFTNEVDLLPSDSILADLGLRDGDRIVGVGETDVSTGVGLLVALRSQSGPTSLTIARSGDRFEVRLAEPTELLEEIASSPPFGNLGIERRHVGFIDGIVLGSGQFAEYVQMMGDFARQIVTGRVAATEALKGPVGVAQILGQGFRLGPAVFFQLLAFLSLNFALLNLIPFPGLDGSRVAFVLYEKIRGRPIPVEREGLIHAIGFAVLIGLMILITYKDLVALFR